MTWKLPEDQNKPNVEPDPWTGRQPDKKPRGSQPPTIEALLKQLWLNLKRKGASWRSYQPPPRAWLMGLPGAVFIIWLGLGIHYGRADQLSYAMRLGVYQGQLADGWQWRAWGLYQIHTLSQPQVLTVKSEVISQDLALAKASMTLTYRIVDPKAYLFSINEPLRVLHALSDSALQQVISQINSAVLLSDKNASTVVATLKPLLQSLVDHAGLGIRIETIHVDDVAIPDSLQELFTKMNAIYVTQTAEKQKNLEYQQQVMPAATRKAQQSLIAAKTYAQQALTKAQSDVAAYLMLLPHYQKNPKLTKYQLYTQFMTTILSESQTVVVDAKNTTPMIVLPDSGFKKVTAPTVNEESAANVAVADTDDSYGNIKGGYGS